MRRMTITVSLLLAICGVAASASAFTSFYVFGDGVSSMTNGPGGSFYYKGTYSNGRVWVEVLAERQGLVCESNKNQSYYGHYSTNLLVSLNSFVPPADASNALYVVWVCDADFVFNTLNLGTNIVQWTNAINNSLTNHFRIITNLYHAKGARHLVMPNAVDLGRVPFYLGYSAANKSFIRTQTTNFNSRYAAMLANTAATLPGLAIYAPDVFTLLDKITTTPASFGLQKPTTYVIEDLPGQATFTGPGTNYVYWDDLNPTAMTHEIVADSVQQMIFPARLKLSPPVSGSNQLTVASVPIGLNGFVDMSTNLLNWSQLQSVSSTNATQNLFLPVASERQFYRLRFPFRWVWP
jgi:phospholipase/lecithinase/hemolysin